MEHKEAFLQKTVVVWLGAMISCLLWGSAFPCVKLGYAWCGITADATADQIVFAGLRFTLAGILTALIGSIAGRRALVPERRAVPSIFRLCMLQTVLQYLFFYIGMAHTSGVKASIIEGVNVFVAVLISALLFHMEQFTTRKLLGCVIGFAGVVLVNLNGNGIDLALKWNGEGFIFLSTVAYAFSSVVMKRYSKEYNPVMLSGYQFILGGLIMLAAGLTAGGGVQITDAKALGMLCYLACVSAVAYAIWSVLLKYNPVSRVAVFGFMNPVFGVLLSAWLLKESDSVGVSALIALLLVCVGIYIVNRPQNEKEGI